MKVFLIGGTGLLGSATAEELILFGGYIPPNRWFEALGR